MPNVDDEIYFKPLKSVRMRHVSEATFNRLQAENARLQEKVERLTARGEVDVALNITGELDSAERDLRVMEGLARKYGWVIVGEYQEADEDYPDLPLRDVGILRVFTRMAVDEWGMYYNEESSANGEEMPSDEALALLREKGGNDAER
jgi:hypothetical protein